MIFLFCFLGPVFWRIDPDAINIVQVTSEFAAPSIAHPFGTDWVGRDEFARAIAGGKISLLVGLVSMLGAFVFGVGIGSFAGFYGGIVDNFLMRFTDIFLSVPLYLLLFVLSASVGDGVPDRDHLDLCLDWTSAARLGVENFLHRRNVNMCWQRVQLEQEICD